MATINDFVTNWLKIVQDPNLYEDSVIDTEEDLIKVNQNQLLDGKTKEGVDTPTYSDQTRGGYGELKLNMNPRANGNFDMRLTGDSFDNMTVLFSRGEFEIDTSGAASEWNSKLGGSLFGIGENKYLLQYRAEKLYPEIVKKIKERLKY